MLLVVRHNGQCSSSFLILPLSPCNHSCASSREDQRQSRSTAPNIVNVLKIPSSTQSERQYQKAGISRNRQRRERHNHITTRPKLLSVQPIFSNLREELPVSLLAPK